MAQVFEDLKANMLRSLTVLFSLTFLIGARSCKKDGASDTGFEAQPQSFSLQPALEEVSGISSSTSSMGDLWAHEDSGHPPRLHLISNSGLVHHSVFLEGAVNRDWEDMARVGSELYIAETGDNNQVFTEYGFYIVPEPGMEDTVQNFQKIRFAYPDGSHDAEAFLVDAQTKDIYVITKREAASRLYKIPFPYNTSGLNTATFEGVLTFNGVVSACSSQDGTEIIVKTYSKIYYFKRSTSQSIPQALQQNPQLLSYVQEPQGEAVSFSRSGNGFYTLSEKAGSSAVNLYFYKRK
jgi:hypothetical protein